MPAFDLDRIAERYLGGQSPAEFEATGGDPREYAELVFSGAVWPDQNPAAPDLGIEDVDDLVQALVLLITRDPRRAALEAHREATQFKPLDPDSPSTLLQVRVPQSLLDLVTAAAAEHGLTRSEFVRELISRHVEQERPMTPNAAAQQLLRRFAADLIAGEISDRDRELLTHREHSDPEEYWGERSTRQGLDSLDWLYWGEDGPIAALTTYQGKLYADYLSGDDASPLSGVDHTGGTLTPEQAAAVTAWLAV